MVTVDVNPDDNVRFLNEDGSVGSVFDYDASGGVLELVDESGSPANQRVGALEADDATIGDVDGFWGGSGKQIILDRSVIMPAGSYSGTNTTYETLNNPEDRSVLDWSVIDYPGISQYNVAFSTYQLRQEGDVVNCEVRIGGTFGDAPETLDGTLIDTTDAEIRPIGVSEDVDLSNFGVWTPQIEARTEAGGEWNIRGQPTVSLIGVID